LKQIQTVAKLIQLRPHAPFGLYLDNGRHKLCSTWLTWMKRSQAF